MMSVEHIQKYASVITDNNRDFCCSWFFCNNFSNAGYCNTLEQWFLHRGERVYIGRFHTEYGQRCEFRYERTRRVISRLCDENDDQFKGVRSELTHAAERALENQKLMV